MRGASHEGERSRNHLLLASSLLGVMAQRLARTLCPHCKTKGEISDAAWQELVSPWKAAAPKEFPRAVGCLECRRTGYAGRVGLYEIMLLTPELRRQVTAETDVARLRDQAWREGMKPLRLAGAMKIAAGLTTLDEVVRVAPPRDFG